jgi:hypothetical protein
MSSGRIPTASEVLDVMDRLERDPERRGELYRGYDIFTACVGEEIVGYDSIDWLAQRMQELHGEGLIAHGPVNGGVREPPVWDGQWLQSIVGWRVTTAGRADAALHRRERRAIAVGGAGGPALDRDHDLFISHAGEDRDAVARPLLNALEDRGWSVWLDELELTLGDSLSGRIDAALARSRFGVAVLSPAYFAKPWPMRELAGLAAREVVGGSKVILPVWHNVDAAYIAARSPILADRVGVSTGPGIEHVADKISRALERAGVRAASGVMQETVVQAVELEAIGLSLLDRLRLALKRGQGFQDQTDQVVAPDADFVGRVCCWHDDIYELLKADGGSEEAQRWLGETPAIPESSRPVIGGPSSFPCVLKQQVKCLEGIIARLEQR